MFYRCTLYTNYKIFSIESTRKCKIFGINRYTANKHVDAFIRDTLYNKSISYIVVVVAGTNNNYILIRKRRNDFGGEDDFIFSAVCLQPLCASRMKYRVSRTYLHNLINSLSSDCVSTREYVSKTYKRVHR